MGTLKRIQFGSRCLSMMWKFDLRVTHDVKIWSKSYSVNSLVSLLLIPGHVSLEMLRKKKFQWPCPSNQICNCCHPLKIWTITVLQVLVPENYCIARIYSEAYGPCSQSDWIFVDSGLDRFCGHRCLWICWAVFSMDQADRLTTGHQFWRRHFWTFKVVPANCWSRHRCFLDQGGWF